METSFVLDGDDLSLDNILIAPAPADGMQIIDVASTRPAPIGPRTVGLGEWMEEATAELVRALHQREVSLPLARLWDPALASRGSLDASIDAHRTALNDARARLQGVVEASEPARARELATLRGECARELKAATERTAAMTQAYVRRVRDAAKARAAKADAYADAISQLERMNAKFRASTASQCTPSEWGERIVGVIEDELERHRKMASARLGDRAEVEPVEAAAPVAPRPYGSPHLDRIASLGVRAVELQALRQVVDAFEGAAHMLGQCACGQSGSCACAQMP